MLKLNAHIDGTTTLWPTFHNLKLDGAEGYQLTGWKSLHFLILLAFGVNLMIFEQAKPSIAAFENFSNIFLKHIVDFNGNNLFCIAIFKYLNGSYCSSTTLQVVAKWSRNNIELIEYWKQQRGHICLAFSRVICKKLVLLYVIRSMIQSKIKTEVEHCV